MMLFSQKISCVAVATALLFLAGCGKDSHDKAATQVAARVNKDEISVHQINFVLARSGKVTAEQMPAASKQVLDKLIDQNLLLQKAVADKMDADPTVMQTVENTRRQILAQAYLDKVMSAAAKPTEQEIHEYYAAHPELFSQRRVYRFLQLSIAGGKEIGDEVQKELAAGKSLADIEAWAKSKNIQVSSNAVVKAAEQLPLELLPRLHQMKDSQVGIIGEANGFSVLQLLASQDQPVDEKAAAATIVQYLTNKRKSELAEAELKRLKAEAKIEYMGEFAKKDIAPATPVADANKTPGESQPKATITQSDTVSKALKGL